MFKLESYITPLLMGYIDKYVKLKHEDFQLSLWGGDVVLNKLDIRLDIIEQALKLPVTIKSGFVHELRIHVPWTRLYSEPVVITINTIECILNLNRNQGDVTTDVSQINSDSQTHSKTGTFPSPTDDTDGEDLPPGYLQSLATKILHNISVVINNLVLKFVEEDIVLSVNIKSAECYSVDADWNRSFVELALPDLALRRVIDFHDLTLCLDKRNASGKIESYQDPMLYRCSLTCRLLMQYKSVHAKLPITTVLNILNERLDVSLTDVQLPMFRRLIELSIALYYGTIDPASGIKFVSREESVVKPTVRNDSVSNTQALERPEKEPEGWASWAWSYVPALAVADEEEEEDENLENVKKKIDTPVFIVGVYITQTMILFKQSLVVEKRRYSTTSAKSSAFKSFLALTINEIGLEVTIKDTTFFDVQFGMTDMQICGIGKDGAMKKVFAQTVVSKSPKEINYMTGCLFADVQNDSREFIFDESRHVEKYNEKYVMDRYGCFWMNYLFTAVPTETEESKAIESPSSARDILERSCQRYILGPTQICVSSTSVDHVRRIIDSLNDYDYEPYGQQRTDNTDHHHRPSRSLPTQSDVQRLEGEISAVTYQVTVLRPCVCIERAGVSVELSSDTCNASSTSAIVLEAAELSFDSSRAMYDRDTSEIGSMISSPSSQLLRSCHSRMNFQVSRIEANLALVDDWPNNAFTSSLYNVVQPFNATLNVKHLLHPRYWKNILQPQCEYIGDIETFSVNLTMGQIFILTDIAWSWLPGGIAADDQASCLSLSDDVFNRGDEGKTNVVRLPVMEFSLSGLHLQYMMTEAVNAATGGIASVRLFILRKEEMRDCIVPIIFGPANVGTLHAQDLRSSNFDAEESDTAKSLVTFTCQMPRNVRAVQAPAIVYVKSLGVILCLDPIIHDWFSYAPTRVSSRLAQSKSKTSVTLDTSLASAAFPLSVRSSQVSESEHGSGVPVHFGAGSVPSLPITAHPLHGKLSVSVPEHEVLIECKKDTRQPESKKSFGHVLADCFPFIKIVDFQMEADPCCAFLPQKHICFQEPTVDIGSMILEKFQSGALPNTLVLCGPLIHVSSSGRKQATIHRNIPVRALDKSLSGDKLPWLIKLHKCSAYTVHDSREFRHLLKPTSLSGTLSVTSKYRDPLSDSISQLNSFFHTDMSLVLLSLSNAQIQLVSELINDGANLFAKFIDSIAMVTPEKTEDLEDGANLLGSDTHKSAHDFQLVSGTSNDPHDSGIFPISESSEKVSFELLQDRRFDNDDDVKFGEIKLTFWMQCTLPKLTIALYGCERNTRERMCVSAKLEDLTFSADVHKVFAKIKCSVGAVSVNHRRSKDDAREHDGLDGILLSSSEILTRNTRTILPPSLIPSRTSRHPSMSEETKNSEQASGFISVVFTRALAENVRRKMDALNYVSGFQSDYSRNMPVKYLNEVCVNCQPFDVVCNSRVLAALLDIFSFPAAKFTSNKSEHSKDVFAINFSRDPQPMISAHLLPLLYINASGFRLFIPCESQSSSHVNSAVPDVCVVQCASISLTPHADNPLPRFVVDNGSYTQHQFQAEVSSVPGSSLEDRQYDVTLHKISVSSSCWKELVSRDNDKESSQYQKDSKGQNPALEWNTSSVGDSQEEVIFVPIITQFDLKLTFAPPILKQQNEEEVIGCGYSTEINVTSDLNIILSVYQIKLLTLISERMSNEFNQTTFDETISSRESQSVFDEHIRNGQNDNTLVFKCTPFDILVTARKLSAMLYSRESVVSDEKVSPDATSGSSETCKNSDNSSTPKDLTKIVPFVYFYVSQPHAIVKFDAIKLKSELAIHDCVVKGSLKDDYRIFEEDRLVPDVSDYPVYWLETRSGKPDRNSGLLPGLFTAYVHVYNFQKLSVDVELVLGRPVALKGSLTQLDQALMFSSRISSVLRTEDVKKDVFQEKREQRPDLTSVPPWLHKISVSTEQFVVVMDTHSMPNDDTPVSVQLALSKFQAGTVFQLTDTKIAPKIIGDVQIQNFMAKVAVNRSYKSFVSPCNLDFDVSASWLPHSGSSSQPRIVVAAKTTCCQVQVVPEIVQSIAAFQRHIIDHLSLISSQTIDENPSVVAKEKKAVNKNYARKLELNPATESIDDLRSGWFAYNTEQCEAAALNPGEISFYTNVEGNYATMTWRYNECRTLMYLKVSPVPFSTQNIDAFANVNSIDDLKVRCIVQNSQSCSGRFEDYVEFYLCENSACTVTLPEQNDSRIVATDVWRILILYPQSVGVEKQESKDPIVSPLVLAASIQVNSTFVRQLVPAFQLELNLTSISVRVFNSSRELKSDALSVLNPYTFIPSMHSHEMLVLGIDDVCVMVSGFEPACAKLHVRVAARLQCDVLECRSLTMLPLLKPCTAAAHLEMISVDKTTKLSAEVQLDRILVRVSRSIVWTLNQIANVWNPSTNPMDAYLSAYYIICNDTQETIYFGQTETDERIAVSSRCATQYAWRTHKRKQTMRLALVDVDLSTSQDIDVDANNVIQVLIKRPNGRETSLVARITTFSNAQKKIVISGRIAVSNLLSQSLEIKLLNSLTTTSSVVESNRCLPSYVLDNSTTLPSLKVRLVGADTSWSQDVNISVARHDGQLVRLQSSTRKDYIHVWCLVIEQIHKDLTQSLVVFSPLFVVSSQLSTSLLVNIESSATQGAPGQLGLEGRGAEKQLELYGGSVVHNLTFQLNPTMPTSSPAISLSADTIQQVNRRFLDTTDLFAICAELHEPNDGRDWPYNDVDDIVRADVSDKSASGSADLVLVVNVNVRATNSIDDTIPDFEQPNINVQVNLLQRWPHLSTLLIDVVPSWLFVNQLCFDVILAEQNGRPWRVPAGKSFAPPAFNEAFNIGILLGGRVHKSTWLTLCCEDDTKRYLPQYDGLLYQEGHLQVNVPIVLNGVVIQLGCLSVHSTFKHQMRVVTVREQFSFCSAVKRNLEILCVGVRKSARGVRINDGCVATVTVNAADVETMRPLLLWNVLTQEPQQVVEESVPLEFVLYVAVRFSKNTKTKSNCVINQQSVHKWSLPVKLKASKTGKRLPIAIPIIENAVGNTTPCALTGQLSLGIVYLCLAEDHDPGIQVHNNCLQRIYFGQAATESNRSGFVVQEELGEILNLPNVEARCLCHYTMPAIVAQFPSTDNGGAAVPKLHLGASTSAGDIHWSRGIDLQTDHSVFVNIPELFDVKVSVKKLRHTLHVYVDSVSRAEISAKEVRSRIKKNVIVETNSKIGVPASPTPEDGNRLSLAPFVRPSSTSVEELPEVIVINSTVQIICDRACLILIDESSQPTIFSEVLRVTLNKVSASLYPTLDIVNSTSSRPMHMRNFLLTVYDMQVDNQLFGKTCYDFPVSFMKQFVSTRGDDLSELDKFSLQEQISWFKSHSLISVSGELCGGQGVSVQSLSVAVKPIQLFIEDAYIWHLLRVIDKIIPIRCSTPNHRSKESAKLPSAIKLNHAILISPLRIEHLCLEPVSVLVSLRATLKMFIATNGTPLYFGRFEMTNVCSTVPQVVRAVTMHYASAAIFRAGLVVGSLEILGNPTGFVRHVGDGVADMFCMPYRGLTVGPGAFLAGITRGVASITRHLSVGTLTSITNFASSVSRNMEQLSLDSDHIHRSELIRMRRPSGLSDGLRNGLTGFGLSMLGAIAGIADQPLQIFTRNQLDNASSASQARGLLRGFGKGLVGIVTKPIGGAAELVSQTSLGMLQQVGLKDNTPPRHKPSEKEPGAFKNSSAKHSMKIIQLLVDGHSGLGLRGEPEVLAHVDATTSSIHIPSDCTLVLTADYLLVVDNGSDQLILKLPISEIECRKSCGCLATIKVVCISADNTTKNAHHARIAAFIDDIVPVEIDDASSKCLNIFTRQSDVIAASPAADSSATPNVYCFKMSRASNVDLFLSQFDVVRCAATKHGFSI